jgi:virulence-associated protein VapD
MTTRNFTHNSKKLEGSQIYDAKVLDFSLNDIEFLKTQGKIIIFVNEEKVNKSIKTELIENLLQKIEELAVEEVKVEEVKVEEVLEEPVSEEVKVEEPVSEELAVEEVKVEEPVSEEVKAPSKKASKKRSVNK